MAREDIVKANRILIDANGSVQARNTTDTQTVNLLEYSSANQIRFLQPINFNSQTMVGVPTPTSPTHAVNKAYADALGASGDITNIDAGNASTNFSSLPVFDGGNA